MTFIDNQHAKEISEWCNKHQVESEAYFNEAEGLSQLFINHEISFDEFKKRIDEIKAKYKFLE
jgi:hypothetical protein